MVKINKFLVMKYKTNFEAVFIGQLKNLNIIIIKQIEFEAFGTTRDRLRFLSIVYC